VAAAARRERVSRSAWIRGAVEARLAGRLPDSFFEVLGAWEDTRSPEQIVRDIRRDVSDPGQAGRLVATPSPLTSAIDALVGIGLRGRTDEFLERTRGPRFSQRRDGRRR